MTPVLYTDSMGFQKTPQFKISPRTTLHRGDPVKVTGQRGKYTFLSHVTPNDRRRAEWCDVVEARTGHIRSFTVNRITKGRR